MSKGERTFERSVEVACSAAEAFAWHERPGALQRLTPPWENVEVESQEGGIQDGGEVVLRLRFGPLWQRWRAEHRDYRAGVQFRDVQREGPFRRFEHLHQFEALGSDRCRLHDRITYELPAGQLGRLGDTAVRKRLERTFRYRHAVTRGDLELPPASAGRVVIAGASGLLGRQLVSYLSTQGWQVHRLVRARAQAPDEIAWDPAQGVVDWPAGAKFDAVVHLAGANLAAGRWTEKRKHELRRSRIQSVRTLLGSLPAGEAGPRVVVGGVAVGYYGETGDDVAAEDHAAGKGFLAELCQDWEQEFINARRAEPRRTVLLRTGVVLTPAGGALAKMLPAFRAGLGGRLGSGRAWMSWISVDDWLDVCRRALTDPRVDGPVNAVTPRPVRNAEFAATLARVLHRPAWLPAPAQALRLALGEMADEALLTSTRAYPEKLTQFGHRFRFPGLEEALRHVLGRT